MKKLNLRRINHARERHERVMKELRRKKRQKVEDEFWIKLNQDLMESPMFREEPSLIEWLFGRFFRKDKKDNLVK